MSFYLPWEFLVAEANYKRALISGAFVGKVQMWEVRDDYIY